MPRLPATGGERVRLRHRNKPTWAGGLGALENAHSFQSKPFASLTS
jgi:hypothetical protein